MGRTALVILVAILAGCSSRPHVTVGSKNFTEQLVLGEIAAQQIERRLGIAVERKLNLGGTLLAQEAVKGGSIDLYPEYTGTALTAVLKRPITRNAGAVLEAVRAAYKPWALEWLDPLGFNNTFAMVVRTPTEEKDNVRTLSDAARRKRPWRLGVGYEFVGRPDGLDGLLKTYDLKLNGAPVTMDLGLLYAALEGGKVEMAAANATDGLLAGSAFSVLEDDRGYFPPYQCAFVVREEALKKYSGLRAALEGLSGTISDADMRRMNAAVEREKRSPAEVAREWLARH
jgi:glycine betaine/choline ABC-type transport system substrate-binding protein